MTAPFSRRAVMVLVGVVAVSFVAALVLVLVGGDPEGAPTSGTSSLSSAALGHRAFAELLRRLDVPVVVSRYATGERAEPGALVIVAEPQLGGPDDQALAAILRSPANVLVVLPKWHGVPDPTAPGRIASAELLDPMQPEAVLRALDLGDAKVVRPGGAYEVPATDAELRPRIAHPQLLDFAAKATPVLGQPHAMLVALFDDGGPKRAVLADPDLIANHGLDDADNAAVAVALVNDLRGPGGVVIFDETLHGLTRPPSVWSELLAFPWSLVCASAALGLLALLVARGRRFGVPEPAAPAIAPGKRFLIDNTAALLGYGGHTTDALERYLAAAVQAVPGPPDRDAVAAFEREIRAVAGRPQRALAIAARIHRWRQEKTDGSPGHLKP
jgi:hypothetical protein